MYHYGGVCAYRCKWFWCRCWCQFNSSGCLWSNEGENNLYSICLMLRKTLVINKSWKETLLCCTMPWHFGAFMLFFSFISFCFCYEISVKVLNSYWFLFCFCLFVFTLIHPCIYILDNIYNAIINNYIHKKAAQLRESKKRKV